MAMFQGDVPEEVRKTASPLSLVRRMVGVLALATLVWLAAFGGASEAQAQDGAQPDYAAWDLRARADEARIDLGTANIPELERMRVRLAEWRAQFLAAQTTNESRIATLEAQIDALGPLPDEGTDEPADIAFRRAELTTQLADLRAPVLRAEEAYTRADGIIREIDGIIRERQTDALLALGPSPLNPAHWPAALDAFGASVAGAWQDLLANAASPFYRAEAQRNLPLILFLLALGGMLIAKGRAWAQAGVELLRGETRRGSGVFRFLVSLGQIILPYLGILALIEAASASALLDARLSILLENLEYWAAILIGAHWLADQTFHEREDTATVHLSDEDRPKARRLTGALAWIFVLNLVLLALAGFDSYTEETLVVLQFPLVLIAGYALVRYGRLRLKTLREEAAGTEDADEAEPGALRQRITRVIAQAAILVGLIGPAMAAIGYARTGEALVYPFIASLAVVGVVLVLQRFFNDLHSLVTGAMQTETDGLIPVLAGFVLSAAAIPVLALIWGAREADLTELWTRFLEGFVVGDTRISPTDFLVVVVVFVAGYLLTRLFQGALKTSILPKTKIDQGGRTAIVSGVGYVGIFIAAIVGITAGGLDLTSLAFVAGALSVGIGFGLQNIVSNFVSGIILLIERPISEGDWIEVNGTHGIVKSISVRSTRIETFDRFDMIVPNADFISGTVSNYTRGNILGRIIVPVGVAYGTDTRKVERILLAIVRDHPMVLMNPAPFVAFVGFGADSLDFEIRAILRDINQGLGVRTEIRHQVVERFAEEGIEIPFAQRDVWLRNPEALTGRPGMAAGAASPSPTEHQSFSETIDGDGEIAHDDAPSDEVVDDDRTGEDR